jgi:hypothetical protein
VPIANRCTQIASSPLVSFFVIEQNSGELEASFLVIEQNSGELEARMRSESTTYGNLQHKSVIIVHMHYSFPEDTDTSIMKPCIHLVFISDTSITNPSKIVEVIDPRSIQCDALRTNKLLEVPFVILRSLVLGKESQRSMIFLNLYAVMPL